MALKTLGAAPKRLGVTAPKLHKTQKRTPLLFVPKAEDPLKNAKPGKNAEQTLGNELKAVQSGFISRAKADAARRARAEDGGDNFTVVFETSAQAAAFIKAVGYPWLDDAFIDGTILAEVMDIKLPAAKFKGQQIKKIDHSLARLVTHTKLPKGTS